MSDSKIHATAIVDRRAQIGSNVEIGPYSIIGPEITIGANSIVQSHVILEGSAVIGSGNFIGHGAVIGAPPQDLAFKPGTRSGVQIGDDNVLREYCSIHRGTTEESVTKVGDKNLLMGGAHVAHNCEIDSNTIIANNCLIAGYVRVENSAFLSGGCVFHQYIRIGRLALCQGRSGFGKDIPPFVIASGTNKVVGLNVIGLRRAGFSAKDREEIKAAFRLIYSSGLNLSQALEKAEDMPMTGPGREFIQFVSAAKKRGICAYKRGAEDP